MVVAGPTASGKSHLAVALAARFGGEVINADSMQVYRDLHVLTARPGAAETARVPHHLYGVAASDEAGSAGRWLEMARAVAAEVWGRGGLPVFCGGTGLYLKVLMEGIAPVPDVPAGAVAAAGDIYDDIGGAAFADRLRAVDPEAAARLNAGDRQRLVRAYSVATETGRTLAEWQAGQSTEPGLAARFLTIRLMPDRAELYARIEARLDAMVGAGALDEVAALAAQGLAAELPVMKSLGVPEFLGHLAGDVSLDDAVAKAKQATRNFAKRQSTWFRHQLRPDLAIDGFGDAAAALDAAAAATEAFLAAG